MKNKFSHTLLYGRSMVEMLGVLAIVGVLSVGAIAGYSKAMMKYKLNKHAEQFNIFINNITRLCREVNCASLPYRPTAILRQMGYLPEGMDNPKNDTGNGVQDLFGHDCHIAMLVNLSPYIAIQPLDLTVEQCINLVEYAVRPNANTVDLGITNNGYWRYSDKRCNHKNRLCLSDVSREDIYTFCKTNFEKSGKSLNIMITY